MFLMMIMTTAGVPPIGSQVYGPAAGQDGLPTQAHTYIIIIIVIIVIFIIIIIIIVIIIVIIIIIIIIIVIIIVIIMMMMVMALVKGGGRRSRPTQRALTLSLTVTRDALR